MRARIEAAAGGRRVLLVAASKMNGADRVREAVAAGRGRLRREPGSRSWWKSAPAGAYEGAGLHFIGHLQRNKVKYLVGSVGLIESVDSVELLGDISARAQRLGVVQDVLLEVNIAGELSKSGVSPERLPELLDFAAAQEGLRVRGLMAIPPYL